MNKRTKVVNLFNANKNHIGIRVTNTKDETFIIPVVDVRVNRERAEAMIKNSNRAKGSKFFRPSYSWIGKTYN